MARAMRGDVVCPSRAGAIESIPRAIAMGVPLSDESEMPARLGIGSGPMCDNYVRTGSVYVASESESQSQSESETE